MTTTYIPVGHLGRGRKICLGLPESTEQETWDHPTFGVRNKVFAAELSP